MTYFPNGTAGCLFEEDVCSRCANQRKEFGGCAITDVHMLYNYEQLREGQEKIRTILSMLITDDGECRMFLDAGNNQ